MLWFWDYEFTKWLIALLLISTLYATIVTSFIRASRILKVSLVLFFMLQAYVGVQLTDYMLGKPRPDMEGFQGYLAGYVVYKVEDKKRIAILIKTTEKRPITFSIPWTQKKERELSQSMGDIVKKGTTVGVRKKEKAEGGQKTVDESDLEIYNLVDDLLVDKQ